MVRTVYPSVRAMEKVFRICCSHISMAIQYQLEADRVHKLYAKYLEKDPVRLPITAKTAERIALRQILGILAKKQVTQKSAGPNLP